MQTINRKQKPIQSKKKLGVCKQTLDVSVFYDDAATVFKTLLYVVVVWFLVSQLKKKYIKLLALINRKHVNLFANIQMYTAPFFLVQINSWLSIIIQHFYRRCYYWRKKNSKNMNIATGIIVYCITVDSFQTKHISSHTSFNFRSNCDHY